MQIQFVVYILTLIIATALVCGVNPKMHKRVVILDHKYKVVDTVQPVVQNQEIIPQPIPVKQEEVKVTPSPKVEPVKVAAAPKPSVKVEQVKPKSIQQPVKPKQQEKKVEKKAETPKEQPKPVAVPAKVVLTPQQETILWNKWRSDLQNKIMDTANIPPLPQGTVFRFSFNVDKSGRITNIKSWSENPKYNPYALQYITPVIRNLQGKSILKFPEGSNRENVNFEGNMRISNTSKYSSSKDYNDVEKVGY